MTHNPPRLSAPPARTARRLAAPHQPVVNWLLTRVLRSPLSGPIDGPVRCWPAGLTYLPSWSCWIPDAVTGGHVSHFPGLLGLMIAAFIVTAVAAGRAGSTDLLRRMARWRVPLCWYAASLVPLAAALAALRFAGHGLPSLAQLSDMPGLPAVGWFAPSSRRPCWSTGTARKPAGAGSPGPGCASATPLAARH